MAANPRFRSLTGPSAWKEVWHQSSRKMLETSGRYFQLTAQSIRQVLEAGVSPHPLRSIASSTETLRGAVWMQRRDLSVRTQNRLQAVIRQVADGGGSEE